MVTRTVGFLVFFFCFVFVLFLRYKRKHIIELCQVSQIDFFLKVLRTLLFVCSCYSKKNFFQT